MAVSPGAEAEIWHFQRILSDTPGTKPNQTSNERKSRLVHTSSTCIRARWVHGTWCTEWNTRGRLLTLAGTSELLDPPHHCSSTNRGYTIFLILRKWYIICLDSRRTAYSRSPISYPLTVAGTWSHQIAPEWYTHASPSLIHSQQVRDFVR